MASNNEDNSANRLATNLEPDLPQLRHEPERRVQFNKEDVAEYLRAVKERFWGTGDQFDLFVDALMDFKNDVCVSVAFPHL